MPRGRTPTWPVSPRSPEHLDHDSQPEVVERRKSHRHLLPLCRPPERLRRPDPERPPPRTRLTRTVGRKAPTHPPHGPGWASVCRICQIARRAKSSAPAPFGLGSQRPSGPCGIPIVLMLLPLIEVPTSFLYGANWESRAWSIIGKQVATGTPHRPDTPMSKG